MIICEYCGRKHREDVDECRGCGAALPENNFIEEDTGYWIDGGYTSANPPPSPYSEWYSTPRNIIGETRIEEGKRLNKPKFSETIKDVVYKGIFER